MPPEIIIFLLLKLFSKSALFAISYFVVSVRFTLSFERTGLLKIGLPEDELSGTFLIGLFIIAGLSLSIFISFSFKGGFSAALFCVGFLSFVASSLFFVASGSALVF